MKANKAYLVEKKDGTKFLADTENFHPFIYLSTRQEEEGKDPKIAWSNEPYMTMNTINGTPKTIPWSMVSEYMFVDYYRLKNEYIIISENKKVRIHIPVHL